MRFADKALAVFKAKGFTEAEIEEARQMVREAWSDEELKRCWVNWVNQQYEVWA